MGSLPFYGNISAPERQVQSMNDILRVALYIRVSTEEQAMHGYSLQAQEDELEKYATDKGFRITKIYRDEGNSARKPALKRPVMQELLADVEAGKIDQILFIKLDRWFRNVREYHKVQAVLDKYRVTWQATMEDYNTATADGRLKVNIMLSVAENESDRTSERIKFVFDAKRQRKEYCFTGAHRPYGYMPQVIDGVKRCVKDPEIEPIVQDFWDYVRNYGSIRKAGIYCNEKYGITRHYRTWMSMSRSELYTGTFYGVVDYCPAYIDRAAWEYIQDSHNTIKKTQRPDRVYLFTGLLRCPECGNTLKGTFKTYPNDRMKEFYSYRCNNGKLRTCTYRHNPTQNRIEKYLLANVRKELEALVLSAEVAQNEKKKRSAKAADTMKINEQMRRLNVIYMSGTISDEEYRQESKRLKTALEKAKVQEQEEKPMDVSSLKEFLATDFESIYKDLSMEDKRRLWRSVIKEIHFDGKDISEIIPRTK